MQTASRFKVPGCRFVISAAIVLLVTGSCINQLLPKATCTQQSVPAFEREFFGTESLENTCNTEDGLAEIALDLDAVRRSSIKQQPVYLSACILVKDEKAYLLEWIVYHFLLGFEHFYVYDNNSTDGTSDSVRHLQQLGLVTLVEWGQYATLGATQAYQITNCWRKAKEDGSSWVLNFDADEFLVTVPSLFDRSAFTASGRFFLHKHLSTAIGLKEGVIILDRAQFGCNGHMKFEKGLQMLKFTTRAVSKWPNLVGKPLMHLKHTSSPSGGHSATTVGDWKVVDAVHGNLTEGSRPVFEPLRLNHYVSRSYEECIFKITNWPGSWREKNGVGVCDRACENSQTFDKSSHVRDTSLSSSVFPCLVENLMIDFGQH